MQNQNTIEKILKISAKLDKVEKRLLTPKRRVRDLVRHMLLLKELQKL